MGHSKIPPGITLEILLGFHLENVSKISSGISSDFFFYFLIVHTFSQKKKLRQLIQAEI